MAELSDMLETQVAREADDERLWVGDHRFTARICYAS